MTYRLDYSEYFNCIYINIVFTFISKLIFFFLRASASASTSI